MKYLTYFIEIQLVMFVFLENQQALYIVNNVYLVTIYSFVSLLKT